MAYAIAYNLSKRRLSLDAVNSDVFRAVLPTSARSGTASNDRLRIVKPKLRYVVSRAALEAWPKNAPHIRTRPYLKRKDKAVRILMRD
jgi:hypothetical protein